MITKIEKYLNETEVEESPKIRVQSGEDLSFAMLRAQINLLKKQLDCSVYRKRDAKSKVEEQ
jgi:hypothetical protein